MHLCAVCGLVTPSSPCTVCGSASENLQHQEKKPQIENPGEADRLPFGLDLGVEKPGPSNLPFGLDLSPEKSENSKLAFGLEKSPELEEKEDEKNQTSGQFDVQSIRNLPFDLSDSPSDNQ
ncbi:MAG: hypothetical protein CMB46_00600 [Euryarchaeota archaeon]|nr:hypothetical protein [Euryarchaeota archaeon]MBL11299.1 hypothetical protein [Euryarchaeota archaeon]|tara:strand:- start:89 stop:451 length:363 start_codon:yes stop_codon:yes gene_type:complete